ncbi:MAG: hypothetical protein RQ736_10145 [Thiogranum sp.]|nr:hypothetical protein [Thiogranum sp.]
MKTYGDISWWYWAATVPMLGAGLAGYGIGFVAAMILTAIQVGHFYYREGSVAAFPVQVRIAYLGLLLLAQWWPFYWVYWLQLVGTTAMVLFDYCLLARIMSLMPWNLNESFSLKLVVRTFFSAPVPGNIRQGLPARQQDPA